MSKELTLLNNIEQFTDTLRHEIAHAIVGPGNHHNRTWRFAAIQIGAKPECCYGAEVIEGKAAWIGTCMDCGKQVTRFRLTRRITDGAFHKMCKYKLNHGAMRWVKNQESNQ